MNCDVGSVGASAGGSRAPASPGGLLLWEGDHYWGRTMDNSNYEDISHLPHACHTQLRRQLCCSYTYMGPARGANLFLQASYFHLMGKQILYGRRSDS